MGVAAGVGRVHMYSFEVKCTERKQRLQKLLWVDVGLYIFDLRI